MHICIAMKYILLILALLPLGMKAQNLHLSVMGGLSNYSGDLHPAFYAISQSKFHGALGAKYDVGEKLTLRSHISYGSIQAMDSKSKKASMKERNLDFKSKVLEFHLGAEYHLFSFNEKWWSPYVFASVGLFSNNPTTVVSKTKLRPLGTEGQGFVSGRKRAKNTQFCLPLGVGFKYALNEDMRVGIEFGWRKTSSDYLDDVSTTYADPIALLLANGPNAVELAYRGDERPGGAPYPATGTARGSKSGNDNYYFTALSFSVRLVLDKYKRIAGLATERKPKKVGCPGTRKVF
jgi:hypothetical protein